MGSSNLEIRLALGTYHFMSVADIVTFEVGTCRLTVYLEFRQYTAILNNIYHNLIYGLYIEVTILAMHAMESTPIK